MPAVSMLNSGHPGTEPWQASLVDIAPSHVAVLALKPAENNDGLILRLQELSGQPTRAAIRIQNSDTLLRVTLKPWQIQTLRLRRTARAWTATPADALEA